MLELALEGEDLLLKPAVEGLELLWSRMIGIYSTAAVKGCGTESWSVVALTGSCGKREGHSCGKVVGIVVAVFVFGKVVIWDVVVDANRRKIGGDEIPQGVHCLRMRAKRCCSRMNQGSSEHLCFVYVLWGKVEGIVEDIAEKLEIERDGRTDVGDR